MKIATKKLNAGNCQKNNIILEAYSLLSHGLKIWDERISQIAAKHHKTNAQSMLRWSVQHGNIVIPKSVTKQRIKENLDIFNFELSVADMESLDGLNENYRIVTF